jgi:methionyl-tRNA synthetase
MRRTITTAIDYPNAAPHMGHVLEKVLADVLARWYRLNGDAVYFQIGTDEHGIKIQQTAEKQNLSPRELVDQMVPLFQDLYRRLDISADYFIRTTDQEKHWPTVRALWKKLEEAGVLERRTYTGLYCSGCERFVTKKDLIDGLCPDHQKAPEEVQEENYFFLLSKETQWLHDLLQTTYRIFPTFRENETMTLLSQGLEDVSFSRPKSSLMWGIPVPSDDQQTMYVWCDALTNYISGIGLLTDHAKQEWWSDAQVTHVIGKDIARFHALIWPTMLKHADIRTPDRLLIHGFLTSDGQKMSKSLGNVVKPEEVLAHFSGNADPLRFYLTHEVAVGNDGDFNWKRIDELYNAKLRNQLGNLLNRVLVMMQKESLSLLVLPDPSKHDQLASIWHEFSVLMNDLAFAQALQLVTGVVDTLNAEFNTLAPWKLEGSEKQRVLSSFTESLRHLSLLLLPFIPTTAQKMALQLGVPYAQRMLEKDFIITAEMKQWGGASDWQNIAQPSILFAPLEKQE